MPLIGLGFVAIVLAAAYYPAAQVQYREVREKSRLERELAALRSRNDHLRQSVARLKTPEGVEDLARSQFGLVRKGEHVAVIVDDDGDKDASSSVAANPDLSDEVPQASQQQDRGWSAFLDALFRVDN